MKYILARADGESFRQTDGNWSPDMDHAERFDYDAAMVRLEELAGEGVAAKIVETRGRKRKTSEAMVMRITKNLDRLEEAWVGKTIGIGYDVDVEVGRVTLMLEPEGEPENGLHLSLDIASIMVGIGEEN